MRIPMRAILISSTISLGYSSFVFACPQWTRHLGLDVWNTFEDEEQFRHNLQRQKELEATGDRVMKRVSLKLAITSDLIDRRITLYQATEQFLALNQTDPELMTMTRFSFPAASDEESVARQAICYARTHLRDGAGPSPERIRELENDLAEIGGQYNTAQQQ